jgi:3D (Asp-Asp-Asp) domain-containing protein
MTKYFQLAVLIGAAAFLASCAEPQPKHAAARPSTHRMEKIRTTAYTRTEKGGGRNAVGERLSSRNVMSAASDWSRFPLGTHFRIVGTNDEYIVDDYGTALVGTNTIDLYKSSRLEMKRWGVRHVDIDILRWGSEEESLKILGPRAKHHSVRQMVAALQKKSSIASQRKNSLKPTVPAAD